MVANQSEKAWTRPTESISLPGGIRLGWWESFSLGKMSPRKIHQASLFGQVADHWFIARAYFHFYTTGITPAMTQAPYGKGSIYAVAYMDADGTRWLATRSTRCM